MQRSIAWALGLLVAAGAAQAQTLPPVDRLPAHAAPPEALVGMDGRRVTTAEAWRSRRAPELRRLFQHYMYGYFPKSPPELTARIERTDSAALGGQAVLREISLRAEAWGKRRINLLVVTPKGGGPAPVFVGPNFCGNHTLLDDPAIRIPQAWVYDNMCPGVVDHRATTAGRGRQQDVWPLARIVARGYAVATFYNGDLDPDTPEFTDGIEPLYWSSDTAAPNPTDWGAVAAWAWGIQRAVDYLTHDPAIDAGRIIVVGHSRNGKAALLAAAFDERPALVIPHQAGAGGTAPSRTEVGETVEALTRRFPHWFSPTFARFSDRPERLPFDQHSLIALAAPRPVLLTNAVDDTWGNPEGQFRMLQAADPVYRLLGAPGLGGAEMPGVGRLVGEGLAFHLRPGGHSMTPGDWEVFMEFADRRLGAP